MTCRSLCLLLLLVGCASPKRTSSRDDWNPKAGDNVIQAFVRYVYADNEGDDDVAEGETPTGLDQEALTVDTDFGYFLSDRSELGFSLDGIWINNEIDDSYTGAAGVFYNLNFALGPRTTLYVGPEVLWVRLDSGGGVDKVDEIAYGGRIGLRFWFTPAVSFLVEPSYLFTPYDDDIGGDQDQFTFKLGVGVKF